MFERRGKKYFHGQWYQHGAYTILQESAHPQSLFLIEECEDQLLECIYQKCNLHTLRVTEDERVHTEAGDYNLFSGFALLASVLLSLTTSFLRVQYNQEGIAFTELLGSRATAALETCKLHQLCLSCGLQRLQETSSQWTSVSKGGLEYRDTKYHPKDFIYLNLSATDDCLYDIAQIQEFTLSCGEGDYSVTVKLLGRSSALEGGTRSMPRMNQV